MKDKNNTPLTNAEKRTYRLILFRRTFSCLGIGLVVSALIGGLYGDRMHFIWALCAVGGILLALGWWEYLKVTETLHFLSRKKEKKQKIPFALRKDKEIRAHKPAFLQKAEAFEDDLTPYTTADEEIFSEKRRRYALVISRMAAGAILLILSFFIPQ